MGGPVHINPNLLPTLFRALALRSSQNDPFPLHGPIVEPQISHFANFTPCEELVPKRHFRQTKNLRMVNFDNIGGLKFTFLIFLTFEESVLIRLICEKLVQIFSDVKNWYSILTNVKNRY